MINTEESLRLTKQAAPVLASKTEEQRNEALRAAARALEANKEEIFRANRADMEQAEEDDVPAPVRGRLRFDEHKLSDVIGGIEDLIRLPDPLFQIQIARELDDGLTLYRETCPIGVIGVIFEARPDALVQISALCIKSGNCAVLKGGREALLTNRILFETIQKAVVSAGLPEHCLLQMEARDEISEMLQYDAYVDLLIPRGSNAFVRYIMENTRIPVMGHSSGICHIYADRSADIEKAVPIIVDAKTQYVSACNTVETLLVHREILPALAEALKGPLAEKNVTVRADEEALAAFEQAGDPSADGKTGIPVTGGLHIEAAGPEDDDTEYLDYILEIKTVGSADEAIDHINLHGSHHTDCIITEDGEEAANFMRMVDSAGVYQNCSTRFADGFRYGFGAEVGISTGKIHARGPVGLEGLVSYKYKLFGDGHIVGDYAQGIRTFHFKNLK